MSQYKQILVTGMGRGGTKFLNRVFNTLGVSSQHEQLFMPHMLMSGQYNCVQAFINSGLQASVCHTSAPYFKDMPDSVALCRLKRNPLHVVRGYMASYVFDHDHKHPYRKFLYTSCPEAQLGTTPIERSCMFYINWMELAAPYIKYELKLEELELQSLLSSIGVNLPKHIIDNGIEEVINQQYTQKLPTMTTKSSSKKKLEDRGEQIRWSDLTDELKAYAQTLGYSMEEN